MVPPPLDVKILIKINNCWTKMVKQLCIVIGRYISTHITVLRKVSIKFFNIILQSIRLFRGL